MSEYTLYHGDCLDVLPTLAAGSVDAVITDPPYGTTACKWDSVIPFEPMWRELKRLIKPRGAIVLFGSQPFTSALVMSNPKWFRYEWVWQKDYGTGHLSANTRPLRSHENICVFSQFNCNYYPQMRNGKPRKLNTAGAPPATIRKYELRKYDNQTGDRYPLSVLPISNARQWGKLHPTQKPLALMEYLVKTYTNEGDTVLDFTMGSGTTGHACANTGRRFIGIERDAGYFAVASERIAGAYAPLACMEVAV